MTGVDVTESARDRWNATRRRKRSWRAGEAAAEEEAAEEAERKRREASAAAMKAITFLESELIQPVGRLGN